MIMSCRHTGTAIIVIIGFSFCPLSVYNNCRQHYVPYLAQHGWRCVWTRSLRGLCRHQHLRRSVLELWQRRRFNVADAWRERDRRTRRIDSGSAAVGVQTICYSLVDDGWLNHSGDARARRALATSDDRSLMTPRIAGHGPCWVVVSSVCMRRALVRVSVEHR